MPHLEEHELKKIAFYKGAKFRVFGLSHVHLSVGFLRVLPSVRPLRCGEKEEITIEYSLKQQDQNPVDIVFLVSCF